MTDAALVTYVTHAERGRSSGLRVWPDGRVEAQTNSQAWQRVTQLGPLQIAALKERIQRSGLFVLRTSITPARASHVSRSTWQATDGDRHADVTIEPWDDANPAAAALRALVLQIDELVGAAQDGRRE
jgi:hypothetical protein